MLHRMSLYMNVCVLTKQQLYRVHDLWGAYVSLYACLVCVSTELWMWLWQCLVMHVSMYMCENMYIRIYVFCFTVTVTVTCNLHVCMCVCMSLRMNLCVYLSSECGRDCVLWCMYESLCCMCVCVNATVCVSLSTDCDRDRDLWCMYVCMHVSRHEGMCLTKQRLWLWPCLVMHVCNVCMCVRMCT